MAAPYIEGNTDGYRFELTIPAMGPWDSLTFRFRPALPEAVYEFMELPKNSGKKRMQVTVKHLLKYLQSWDVKGKDGNTVPLNEDALHKTPAPHLDHMLLAVNGYTLLEQEEDVKN